MNQRFAELLLIAGILAVFAGLTAWLMNRARTPQQEDLPALSSLSPQPDGAMAFYELLREEGFHPLRYHGSEYHWPDNSCMVMLYGNAFDLQTIFSGSSDVKALRLWLEDGGRLLLVCGDKSMMAQTLFAELELITEAQGTDLPEALVKADGGTQGIPGNPAASDPIYSTGYIYKLPAERPPLFREVSAIELVPTGSPLVAQTDLLLAGIEKSGQSLPLVYYAAVGEGEVVCLTTPEVCSNLWIGRHSNSSLLLSLVSYLSTGRQVYFNEYIHGYAFDRRNLSSLLLNTDGGRLILLAALMVLLAFAGYAVSPARSVQLLVPRRRQATEMVLAQADLFQRARARFVIAESLVERLRRAMYERLRLSHFPTDAQVADWLRENGDRTGQSAELEAFLQDRLLPSTGRELLQIARACDRARAVLEATSSRSARTGG